MTACRHSAVHVQVVWSGVSVALFCIALQAKPTPQHTTSFFPSFFCRVVRRKREGGVEWSGQVRKQSDCTVSTLVNTIHCKRIFFAKIKPRSNRQLMGRLRASELLHRNVQRLRGGLVFKAHRLLYHSTLGFRVITKKKGASLACRDPEVDSWYGG